MLLCVSLQINLLKRYGISLCITEQVILIVLKISLKSYKDSLKSQEIFLKAVIYIVDILFNMSFI